MCYAWPCRDIVSCSLCDIFDSRSESLCLLVSRGVYDFATNVLFRVSIDTIDLPIVGRKLVREIGKLFHETVTKVLSTKKPSIWRAKKSVSFVNAIYFLQPQPHPLVLASLIAAWAAANLATGTRSGEQLT